MVLDVMLTLSFGSGYCEVIITLNSKISVVIMYDYECYFK